MLDKQITSKYWKFTSDEKLSSYEKRYGYVLNFENYCKRCKSKKGEQNMKNRMCKNCEIHVKNCKE